MNAIWQSMTPAIGIKLPILVNDILAQAAKPTAPQTTPPPVSGASAGPLGQPMEFFQGLNGPIVGGINLVDIGLAIVILLVGWLVAALLAGGIGSLLKRTNLDNRLGAWITGRQEGSETLPTEKWISTAVFWVVMIFVLVAFFDKLRLTAVSVPLNTFLTQITGFLPKLGSALILIGVAWGLATVAKLVVTRGLRAFGLDERLNEQAGTTPTSSPLMLSETLANALYWFIFLLFLTPILETLGLQQALEPVKNLLDQILSALPKILKAVVIGGAGWLLATVVRRIVTNLLAATGTDRLGAQFGVSRATSGQSLSGLLGTIVYVLVLIPTAIASLNALEIDAISQPAIGMLNKILSVLPNIFTAGLILVGAYFLGRFISDIVTNILSGIGFNNILYWLGVQSTPTVSRTRTAAPVPPQAVDEDATVLQPAPVPTRSPSEVVGIVVLVGIMLFAIVTATDVLGLTALTGIFYQILEIAGRVLIGLVVFAIGLYFANLAFHLIRSSGGSQAQMLAHAARISIITLVGAMALQQMGIAPDIVNLAFGLLLGAIAVAVALAFGLGGRDIAAHQIREWLAAFKERE